MKSAQEYFETESIEKENLGHADYMDFAERYADWVREYKEMTRDEKILEAARKMHRVAWELSQEAGSLEAGFAALEFAKLMYKNFVVLEEKSENSDKEIAKAAFLEMLPELMKTVMNKDLERILARQGMVIDVAAFTDMVMEAIGYKAKNPIVVDK